MHPRLGLWAPQVIASSRINELKTRTGDHVELREGIIQVPKIAHAAFLLISEIRQAYYQVQSASSEEVPLVHHGGYGSLQ